MANVTIPQVEGGQTTAPTMGYTAELDDGSNSVYSQLSDILKLAVPEGKMVNGKLSVTVASNNLTVAVKTTSGSDPSSTNPVLVKINGTIRAITGALSLTVNAGANTFNAGGSELATKEIDYFVYLSWRTASSAVVILASRIPFARLYSDFSATATNEKYAAFSTAPASTDDCVVIGRFAATLSAGAGYTWTVPTFDSSNLVQEPVFETRWLNWAPAFTGFSANPGGTHKYNISSRRVFIVVQQTAGTSNATGFTLTIPIAPVEQLDILTRLTDNGSASTGAGLLEVSAASITATCYATLAGGSWTNSGNKLIQARFFYSL